jgi:hypothetical protein
MVEKATRVKEKERISIKKNGGKGEREKKQKKYTTGV